MIHFQIFIMNDRFQNVRVPTVDDNVYKDECLYSFDNPESEHGLFICMSTFYGLGKDHLDRHCRLNSTRTVFLNILRRRQRKIVRLSNDQILFIFLNKSLSYLDSH